MTDIIGFNGPPRSGKTAAVAALGLWYARRGYTVLNNFEIYHSNCRQIEVTELIAMLKRAMDYDGRNGPLYPRHVLCAQEIYGWLESRMGMDKAVILIGYFVFYSGKMGVSIVYDAQLNSSVDKRLKSNVTARFEAERLPDRFVYHELDIGETEVNTRTGRRRSIPLRYMQQKVFPFYNTYKVSKPVGFDRWLDSVTF